MNKKAFALVLVALLAATLCFGGCSQAPAQPAASAPAAEAPAAAEPAPAAAEPEVTAEPEVKEWVPDKTITFVVGLNPGGGIDTMARTIQPAVSEYLGVDIIVENMVGSSTGIAAEYVMSQPADGYTIFACSSSTDLFSTTGNANITYKDMYCICMPYTTHNPVVIVNGNSGIKTIEEWYDWVSTTETTASTCGVGSTFHTPAVCIADELGFLDKITFIPYDSGQETTLAVARGEVDWSTSGVYQESSESILAGMVTPLAMCTRDPFTLDGYGTINSILDVYPQLDTFIDIMGGWRGFCVSIDTPPEIIAKLTEAFKYGVESPDFQSLLERNGVADLEVLYGDRANANIERAERIFSYLFYDLGETPYNPADSGLERWE